MDIAATNGDNTEAEMSEQMLMCAPTVIVECVQRLLSEYTRLEQVRQQSSYNESRLHARISELEHQLQLDERARGILAKRVAMLEYALRHRRADVSDSSTSAAKVTFESVQLNATSPTRDMESSEIAQRSVRENKYKTLPSNFLASSRNANMMSPSRRMLWQYLEELGYMPPEKIPSSSSSTTTTTTTTAMMMKKMHHSTSTAAPITMQVLRPSTASIDDEEDQAKSLALSSESKPPNTTMKSSNEYDLSALKPKAATGVKTTISAIQNSSAIATEELKKFKAIETIKNDDNDAVSTHTQARPTELTWCPKLTLLHHLDAVRSVCFMNNMNAIISASEDGTVKMWNIDSDRGSKRAQPVHTFRGHHAMTTTVAISNDDQFVVSGGVDSRVIVWNLPNTSNDPYDFQGAASRHLRSLFNAHTDAVWDVHIPASSSTSLLLSASADATVNVWKIGDMVESKPLLRSLKHHENAIPVSVCTSSNATDKALVAYVSGDVVQFDIESGVSIRVFDNAYRTHLLSLQTHSHHPLAFAGGSDHSISFFDINSGACVHRMLAHASAVTSIAVSSDGNAMMSASHDSSIRFWDVSKRVCIQDLSPHQTHRRKYGEGIHSVAYHPKLAYVASGGADCAVKVYQSS